MTSPLDRAKRLIALAIGNANLDEARNAALAAVKIIHEHRLLEQQSRPATFASIEDFVQHAVQETVAKRAAADAARIRRTRVRDRALEASMWDDGTATGMLRCYRCGGQIRSNEHLFFFDEGHPRLYAHAGCHTAWRDGYDIQRRAGSE